MGYILDYQNHWSDSPGTSIDQAEHFVAEAIAKDEREPFAHYVAAVVAMFKKDYEQWAREADRALSLNPNYALALNARGIVHIYTGSRPRRSPSSNRR